MPYTIEWYIKDEIIYTYYWGAATPDELRECLRKTQEFIDTSPRDIVHIISDVGDVIEPVSLKESMAIVRDVGGHPRAGWTISIREKSMMLKMGAALGSSIFKLRYRAFSTLDQAILHLKYFDPRLSWDKVEPKFVKKAAS